MLFFFRILLLQQYQDVPCFFLITLRETFILCLGEGEDYVHCTDQELQALIEQPVVTITG